MLNHQRHAQTLAVHRNPAPRLYGLLDSAVDMAQDIASDKACDLAVSGLISTLDARGVPYEQAVSLPYDSRTSIADKAMNAVPVACASKVGALLNLSPIFSGSNIMGWIDLTPKAPVDWRIVNVPNLVKFPIKRINVPNLASQLSPEAIETLQSIDPIRQEELFNVGGTAFDWKKLLLWGGVILGGASMIYVITKDQ